MKTRNFIRKIQPPLEPNSGFFRKLGNALVLNRLFIGVYFIYYEFIKKKEFCEVKSV